MLAERGQFIEQRVQGLYAREVVARLLEVAQLLNAVVDEAPLLKVDHLSVTARYVVGIAVLGEGEIGEERAPVVSLVSRAVHTCIA